MDRREWLLLLIATSQRLDGLDPVRVQKGMFLLAQEAGLPPGERYMFVPYNYGPMSVDVYRDLDELVVRELIQRRPRSGYRWTTVTPTARGTQEARKARDLAVEESPLAERRLRRIVWLIDVLGFGELLATVYRRYPTFATRSVFRP
jgi:hypothetical protein